MQGRPGCQACEVEAGSTTIRRVELFDASGVCLSVRAFTTSFVLDLAAFNRSFQLYSQELTRWCSLRRLRNLEWRGRTRMEKVVVVAQFVRRRGVGRAFIAEAERWAVFR